MRPTASGDRETPSTEAFTSDDADERQETYDAIVLGGGAVGEVAAERIRSAGLTTVLVENDRVGGECSYWACMPSKALLRPIAALAETRAVAGARQAVIGELDTSAVFSRRDDFTSHWKDDGQVAWLESAGVDLVRGRGRFDGPRRIVVTTPEGGRRVLTARHAVAVCTGSRPKLPDLPGIAEAHPWTSRDGTSAREVPGHLAIVGGGVVAVEMATIWQGLGSSVTMFVRGNGLLTRMEPFAGELVAEALSAAGVEIRMGTSVAAVRREEGAGGPVTITLGGDGDGEGGGDRIVADQVLFATGRAPRTGDLGLETIGLEPGSWLQTDDTCQVTAVKEGWLYAVGDANHRALLTHQGKYQARIAGAVIGARAKGVSPLETHRWGAHVATADSAAVPQVVFTSPEVAAVGLTEAEARQRGHRVRAVDYDLGQIAGASLFADGYQGRARMVVDLDRGHLLGATFAGPGVGELLHSATVAVAGEVPLDRLWHAVPAFPTMSEIWLRLLETYRG